MQVIQKQQHNNNSKRLSCLFMAVNNESIINPEEKPSLNGAVSLQPSDGILEETIGGGGSTTPTTISVKSVKIDNKPSNNTISLFVGATRTLTCTISPANATNKKLQWKSNNSSVVSVSNGVLTANSIGTATITVNSGSNIDAKDSINISVYGIESDNIYINIASITGLDSPIFKNNLKQYGIELSYDSTYNEDNPMYPKLGVTENITIQKMDNDNIIIDNGLIGYDVDPTELLYKGGEAIIPKTIAEKDGTLFLGNIKLSKAQTTSFLAVKNVLKEVTLPTSWGSISNSFALDKGELFLNPNKLNFTPSYKYLETYRFGIQLQDDSGKWSPAIPIMDSRCTVSSALTPSTSKYTITRPIFTMTLLKEIVDVMRAGGYKRVRPIVVLPTETNREIVAQGILCPTVYNLQQRKNGTCANQSSWFFRPTQGDRFRFGSSPHQRCKYLTNLSKDEYNENKGGLSVIKNSAFWDGINSFKMGHPIEYRHNALLAPAYSHAAEFPFMWHSAGYAESNDSFPEFFKDSNGNCIGIADPWGPTTNVRNASMSAISTYNELDYYAVDKNVLTFHSPEIEFNKIYDLEGCTLRLVGYVQHSHTVRDAEIRQEGSYFTIDNTIQNSATEPSMSLNMNIAIKKENLENKDVWMGNDTVYFNIFPWDREIFNGSDTTAEKLKVNKSSRLHVFNTSHYFPFDTKLKDTENQQIINYEFFNYKLADSKIFNGSTSSIVLRYAENTTWADGYIKSTFIYKGNVDDLLTSFNSQRKVYGYWNAVISDSSSLDYKVVPYKVTLSYDDTASDIPKDPFGATVYTPMGVYGKTWGGNKDITPLGQFADEEYDNDAGTRKIAYGNVSKQSISLSYNSSPHGVLVLDNTTRIDAKGKNHTARNILPRIGYYNAENNTGIWQEYSEDSDTKYYYSDGYYGKIFQNALYFNKKFYAPITANTNHTGYLFIADLVRDISAESKFGKLDNESNIWVPAGDAVNIEDEGSINVACTIGDTFFSQYDCLKTYPKNSSAYNQVTEIGSFWVETRVNTAARYDNNKNSVSNMHVSPTNFNLFNPVYDQQDNFFSSRVLEDDVLDNVDFPSTFTWSKQKFKGDKIDVWANITMAATHDLNAIDGEIVKLYNFNNELFSFQTKGINHILFNSRVQLNASDGVPIEISNGYRVDGARKISSIGCSNIKCINDNVSNIYFTDSLTKGIYSFNGSLVESLSDKLNFSVWANENITNNSHVYVDHSNKNIYFKYMAGIGSNKKFEVLGYSELLENFESFYSYKNSIFKTFDSTYTFGVDIDSKSKESYLTLYKLYSNTYKKNDIGFEDSYISFIHNNSSVNNKCYSHIEFKSTPIEYQQDTSLPFNYVEVEDAEGNIGYKKLEYSKYTPSSIKKKFNSWNIEIPRFTPAGTVNLKTHNFKRFQNPWVKISLQLDRSPHENTNKIGNELGHEVSYLNVVFLE